MLPLTHRLANAYAISNTRRTSVSASPILRHCHTRYSPRYSLTQINNPDEAYSGALLTIVTPRTPCTQNTVESSPDIATSQTLQVSIVRQWSGEGTRKQDGIAEDVTHGTMILYQPVPEITQVPAKPSFNPGDTVDWILSHLDHDHSVDTDYCRYKHFRRRGTGRPELVYMLMDNECIMMLMLRQVF